MDNITNTINFLFEVGSLRHIQRSYNQHLLQTTESVAEHSHRVIIIAYILATKANANPYKTMLMATFHDLAETRTGDFNWHQKQYCTANEQSILEKQILSLGSNFNDLKNILDEYKKRKTLESKLAKDADYMEYILSLKEHELTGNLEAKRRIIKEEHLDHFYTPIAKELVKKIIKSKPNSWYQADRKSTAKYSKAK